MHKIFCITLTLVLAFSTSAQKLWQKQGIKLVCPECYASDKIEKAFVPPPAEFITSLKSAKKTSEIVVTYRNFPSAARTAFEYAANIWESLLDSPVPIYIQANWKEKEENVLGSCGPTDFKENFEGAPHKNIHYPIALVEKIQGIELTGPERPDMIAEFNSKINWYFGLDGNTPLMMYDFVSVVLHEIGHGLGFTGFFFSLDLTAGYNWVNWGDASSFDRLVVNGAGEQLIDSFRFENPSVELKNQLTSGFLYAYSPTAITTESHALPRLYAPTRWNEGSSIYHLNDATYPSGTINTLMTHSFGRGEATHHPGPLTLAIMADLGWKNMRIEHTPVKDQETAGLLNYIVKITSDYPLDPSRLHIVFSTDSFATHSDSISLLSTEPDFFETRQVLQEGIELIHYYISAADSMNRVFTYPADAPHDFFVVNIGPDEISPTIAHEPVPYYFDNGSDLLINAQVEDNLGIDTVFVEYAINGIQQQPFGLSRTIGSQFSGVLPISSSLLSDMDVISYYIVAIDASSSANTQRYPRNNEFSFLVEKMFTPKTSYNSFFNDEDKKDFILTDFDIFTPKGFENSALHSPHPYPSPNEDDREYHFTTMLKHPIILNGDATMRFDEIVLVEPGNERTRFGDFEFWDFVVVEGSKDHGETWLPLADGYDSREHEVWEESYYSSIANMNSTTVGTPDLYINREINMLENGNFSSGDTILIRFRLYSDPYANGWGWAIDNLQIQLPVTASPSVLSPGNIVVYPNPFSGSFSVTIHPRSFLELLQFDLYTMHGQKVKSFQHKNINHPFTSKIDLESGSPGIYLLIIKENGKQVLSKKIIHN